MTKSKKFDGVYTNALKNGDISFYITYKNLENKLIWFKIGTNKKGSKEITEKYCSLKRSEILNKLRLGEDPANPRKKQDFISFDEIAKKYFISVAHINKDIRNPKARYANHIFEKIGHKNILEITFKDIEAIQIEKLKSGLAPKTVNHITTLVKTILSFAVLREDIKIDLSQFKKQKDLKVNNDREKFLTLEEIELLKKEVEKKEDLKLFVLLALSTGGRLETIISIKKRDIDLTNGIINLQDFKNGTKYKGFITLELQELLKNVVEKIGLNDNIFTSNKNSIRKRVQDILNRLFNVGLESNDRINRTVVHTLRHTFASHLAIQGTPILTIQKLLNHKDLKMTLRYAKLAPDNGRSEVLSLYSR